MEKLEQIKLYLNQIFENKIEKIIFSNPAKNFEYKKIIVELKQNSFLVSAFTNTQVFHKNIKTENILNFILENEKNYSQFNFFSENCEYAIKISKKEKIFFNKSNLKNKVKTDNNQNRKKNYILKENTFIEPLIDMGIFNKDGKIIASMYDKYKQINRFIEIIDDNIKNYNKSKINIIDFGCGKSYLTFVLYYYFKVIKKIDVNIIGLDLKEEVIKNCNETALKYGYDNLKFELGDINGFTAPFNVDMVITLHACDTATDYALFNAIKWNAKYIFSVPCCQHELNNQINTTNFNIITRYGIAKERISALFTDIIRCNLLESMSYKTQLMEFIDFSHTPKNLLIRAELSNISNQTKTKMINEVLALMNEFNLSPMLYNLLKENNMLKIK